HLLDVLPEVAHRELLRHGHFAVVWRLLADDHSEERRFARPVRPDEPDLLTRVELKRGVDEQDLLAVLLVDAVESDHVPCIVAKGVRVLITSPRQAHTRAHSPSQSTSQTAHRSRWSRPCDGRSAPGHGP